MRHQPHDLPVGADRHRGRCRQTPWSGRQTPVWGFGGWGGVSGDVLTTRTILSTGFTVEDPVVFLAQL
jgi:hypothetical protein